MSVLLETSLGDLVIDLDVERCPTACTNFLKLAKTYYYTYNVFFSVQKGFLAQTGDPTATGNGGQSIWSQLPSSSKDFTAAKLFTPERVPGLKHRAKGTVSMALTALSKDEDAARVAGSQFFITLDKDLDYLDGKHAPFAHVVEGQEPGGTLDKINDAFVDQDERPLQDIRIRHVEVLDDPFEDPDGLLIPSRPPSPKMQAAGGPRLADDEQIEDTRTEEEKEKAKRDADTNAAALTLEMVGDLPFAEVRPPENILFVCKLNPVTRGEDLKLLFGRFGEILSCEVIRDKKTGDSLQYAFIEFDKREAAEMAYFKMQNVLIDDRRIWVDFSQSVSNLHKGWLEKRIAGTRGLRPDHPMHSSRMDGSKSTTADYRRFEERRRDDGLTGSGAWKRHDGNRRRSRSPPRYERASHNHDHHRNYGSARDSRDSSRDGIDHARNRDADPRRLGERDRYFAGDRDDRHRAHWRDEHRERSRQEPRRNDDHRR